MFDRVRQINLGTVDARLRQTPVQHAPRRADERVALEVLLIARLLADQHEPGPLRALAEHRPGRVPVQIAALAAGRRVPQRREIEVVGKEPGSRVVGIFCHRHSFSP
jgi:hypothetical protein